MRSRHLEIERLRVHPTACASAKLLQFRAVFTDQALNICTFTQPIEIDAISSSVSLALEAGSPNINLSDTSDFVISQVQTALASSHSLQTPH